jgi:predicted GTPase
VLETLLESKQRQAIARARERLERARFVLAVVGEFSSGKSFLINALLGRSGLLATDINPSTATITEIEYGESTEAYAYYEGGRRERIPVDSLDKFVASDEEPPLRVVLHLDSPFLGRGFTVADTPGLASIDPAHRRATLQFLPSADAVLYLIDTQEPFTEGDASFLEIVHNHLDTIFIVQTKIDLWERPEANGKPAWQTAYDRICALAAIHAPAAYVHAISARRYVDGFARGEPDAILESRFEPFLASLDASLVRNTGRARLRRSLETVREAAGDATARIAHDRRLLQHSIGELHAFHAQEEGRIAALQAVVTCAKAGAAAAAARIGAAVRERGQTLADEAETALSRAFDAADIARLRDRARLRSIVDRTLSACAAPFADDVTAEIFEGYARAAEVPERAMPLRFPLAAEAASAFGSAGTSNAWTYDPRQALSATIVLEAIGGPAATLAQELGARFSGARADSYMKREMIADLRAAIWPAFRARMHAYADTVAARAAAIGDALVRALEDAYADARDASMGSIERALLVYEQNQNVAGAEKAMLDRIASIDEAVCEIAGEVDAFLAHSVEIAAADAGSERVRRAHVQAELDREAYLRGLQPTRWRVAVLGALRRGKSSLINAFAGNRVLADEVAGAIAYPVHVRYGESEAAFALGADGRWREIATGSALEEAARNPVLILTPWKLPRELVLVHAPAFDAGDATLEDVCMVAAGEASEILCLFSRQLSDREMALYRRVGELGKPMLFAHTLADNETAAERRGVVELAQRYLRESAVPVLRIFTVSTFEYEQAKREHRAPAAWNELDALIATISAHAEEHMARLERLARAVPTTVASAAEPPPSRRSGFLRKFFGR